MEDFLFNLASETAIGSWLVGNTVVAFLIGLIALIVDRIAKRPMLAHCLWVLVLIKLVAPPISRLPISCDSNLLSFVSTGSIADSGDASRMTAFSRAFGSTSTDSLASGGSLSIELALIWFVGSLAMLAWILRASRRVHRLIERRGRFDIEATRQIGLLSGSDDKSPPPVWLVDAVVSPMLVSPMFRRLGGEVRIVFPKALWSRLDHDSRSVLLLHELEHWRRQDWIVRFIEVTIMTLMWWHPLVWIAKLQIEDCEERCCDRAATVRSRYAPKVYAEAILKTLDFLCEPVERNHCEIEPRPIASGVSPLPKLQHRLREIMKPTSSNRFGWSGPIVVTGMLAILPIYPVIDIHRPAQDLSRVKEADHLTPEILTAGSKVEPEMNRRADDVDRSK